MIVCNKNMPIIDFLNLYYPTYDVHVHICDGYDCIESPDGTIAFGVYDPQKEEIFVAGDIPEKEYTLPHTIAHEFRHHVQHKNHRRFDEEDANSFADGILYRMKQEERK